MEELTVKTDAYSLAEKNMLAYMASHDVKYVAEDGIFKNLTTGEEHKGRAEVGAMLHYIYHIAFDARFELTSYIITEKKAQVEGFFKGRHIGEIAGIQATNKEVDVPISVSYDLENGLIKEGRIFMLTDVMFQQLGVQPGGTPPKVAYVVRDIFHLKFGQYREVKALFEEAEASGFFPKGKAQRTLTDFTGESYRLIMEEGYDSLTEYEASISSGMATKEFQEWYGKFKPYIERSSREILKQVR